MAKATVSLTVTPLELQIIDEALRVLAQVGKYPDERIRANLDLFDGVPRDLVMMAQKLRRDMGVKGC